MSSEAENIDSGLDDEEVELSNDEQSEGADNETSEESDTEEIGRSRREDSDDARRLKREIIGQLKPTSFAGPFYYDNVDSNPCHT